MHHVYALLQSVSCPNVTCESLGVWVLSANIHVGVRVILVHFTQPYEPMICVICHRSIVNFKESKIGNSVSCQAYIPNPCSFHRPPVKLQTSSTNCSNWKLFISYFGVIIWTAGRNPRSSWFNLVFVVYVCFNSLSNTVRLKLLQNHIDLHVKVFR